MENIMGNSLTRKQIEEIYNSAPTPGQTNNNPAPSFNMSRDEIANIYNSYTPEIPKLDQNTTPTPTSDYRAEIERMNKLKADTTAPRTEGENQAIDTYLNSLTDAQRYLDSQKPVSTTTKSGTKVKKQPIGTVEIKADGTKKFTKAMSAEEKKNFENQIRRQNQLEQAKVVGKQAKENAQPRERALSANEQRDLERAQSAIAQAQAKEREQNSLPNKLKAMAEPFTKLPKKDKPQYDRAGFEINPSITDNQSIVDEYLDPNKKLSQADEEKAKQLIREYEESDLGQKNENATTLVFDNAHPDGRMVPSYTVDENGVYHSYLELTPEERQYQQSIGALKTKVKDSESFLVGAMKTIPFVDALMLAGDSDGEYAKMTANSQKQNPLAYTGGLLTGGIMANTAGRFALGGTQYGDWLEKTLGADKSLGRRILTDTLMDAPVDVATDIIPTLTADLASDKTAGQVIGNTALNTALNAGFNLGGAALSNAGDIAKALSKKSVLDDSLKLLEGEDLFAEMAKRGREAQVEPEGFDYFNELKRMKQMNEAASKMSFIPGDYKQALKNHTMTRDQVIAQTTPQYQDMLKRLSQNEDVSIDEMMNIPEVQYASARMKRGNSWKEFADNPERKALQDKLANDYYNRGSAIIDGNGKVSYNGNVERGKKVFFVTGLPASGKSSTLVDKISQHFHARILDSDDIKFAHPDFDNGFGSNYIHEESKEILKKVSKRAKENGENLVIPIIGGDEPEKLAKKLKEYSDNGWEVAICQNDLPSNKAMGRAMTRYITDGRYIPPEVLKAYGDTPHSNYLEMIERGKQYGLKDLSGFARVDNDVAAGNKAITKEYGGSLAELFGPEEGMERSYGQMVLGERSGNGTGLHLDTNQGKQPIQGAFFDANEIPTVENPEKQIMSINPDLNNKADADLFKTVENNSAIDVKSVKAANKQLDDNINSLANMFGKQKNNEGVVALKEALNEYAETGSEEALTRARTIASNMDDYYSGATYKSRKGNITDFGNGTKGTFTSQVDDYADKLKAGATLKSEPLHVTDLDKRINDLFSKYDLSAEDAESVRAWKQAINDYMAEPTEESWNNLLSATNDVSKRSSNLSEYVSSYKGKTKTNPFDNSELISIMDEIDTRRPLSSGASVPNAEVARQATKSFNAEELDQIKNEVQALKRSFIGKSKYVGDLNNKYAITFRKSLDEFANNPTAETYATARKALDDYIANSSTKRMRAWNGDWYDKTFDNYGTDKQSKFAKSLDDFAHKYGLDQTEPVETTARQATPTSVPNTEIPKGNGERVERGASRHIRSVNDVTEYTPMKYDVPDEVSNDFIDNPDMYNRLKNVDTQARADAIYEQGGDVETKFRSMLAQKDPASLPLGHRIAKDYSAAGDYEKAAQIYRDMGEKLTEAGQFSQASILAMMKSDPLTALYYAQKEIDALNTSGAKQYGKKWKNFELTPAEKEAFNKIAPGDEKAIAELYDQIGIRIGKDYPATFMDKLLEGRRVSMLFNLRTNVRNIGANVPTLGMRWMSDRVDALGQNIAHLIDPDFKVTNSLKGSGFKGRKLATQWLKSDEGQKLLKSASGKGKYSPDITSSLLENKQVFKGTPLSKWLDRTTGKAFNKAAEVLNSSKRIDGGIQALNSKLFGKQNVESTLETLRNATYKALELGDDPFVKENFVERLGSYINAQGIKSIDEIPDDAIQTAWEEAMKATYKDNSWAVKMLRGMKKGMEEVPVVGRPLSQAVIPFLQAPGNIAARMVDYSPIRGIKGIADIVSGAKNLDQNAIRRGIEEVSKGVTGTGMVILGMKLKESGLLTGGYSEDKDQRNFQKMNGFKPYALHIGDSYISYDWAQPFAEPMIIGTLLQEAIENSDQYDSDILNYFGIEDSKAGRFIGGTKEGAKATFNSWFNASPLQGMADLLKGDYTGQGDVAQNLYDTAVTGFAGAIIPSLSNAIAKTNDPIQRNTTDPSNTFGTFLNAQAAKLPGLSDNLPAAYDTWGEEKKYANSKGEAFLQRFIVPGEYGTESDDPIDNEINRLFEETADNRVFPLTAPTSVDGIKLNNREVSEYQEDMGQRSREIVEALMDSDYYDGLKESNKAETLNTVYSVSKAITERDLFDKEISDNSEYKKAIAAYDEGGAEGLLNYLEGKAITNSAGVSTTSKAGQIIQDRFNTGDKEGAQALANDITTLEGYGIPTKGQGVYADRGSYNYDAETYSRFYNQIDVGENGEPGNGSVSQDEMIKFFEKNHITDPVRMQKMWESFLTTYTPGETKVPYYDKESKTVKTKKPDDSFKSTIPGLEETPETKIATPEQDWESATLSDDPYTAIAQSGVGKDNGYINDAWDKAILADPSLTPQQFIKEWSVVDKDKSGSHSQQEIVDHMNSAKMDKEKGEKFLAKYWSNGWKKTAKLDNNGKWYYS